MVSWSDSLATRTLSDSIRLDRRLKLFSAQFISMNKFRRAFLRGYGKYTGGARPYSCERERFARSAHTGAYLEIQNVTYFAMRRILPSDPPPLPRVKPEDCAPA